MTANLSTPLFQATMGDFVRAIQDAVMPKEQMQAEVIAGLAPTLGDLADILGVSLVTMTQVNKGGWLKPASILMGRKTIVYDIDKARECYKAYKAEANSHKSRYVS